MTYTLSIRTSLSRGWGAGVLPKKLGRGVRPSSQNPNPIYDQNLYPIFNQNLRYFPTLFTTSLWLDQNCDTDTLLVIKMAAKWLKPILYLLLFILISQIFNQWVEGSGFAYSSSGEEASFTSLLMDYYLFQLVEHPTRGNNILDLVIINTPTFITVGPMTGPQWSDTGVPSEFN